MIILPFIIILVLALCLSVLLKLKPIESIVFAISSIIIILLIATLLISLSVAIYIICALSSLLLIASFVKLVKRKKLFNSIKDFALNPGILLYIGIVGVYVALIYDKHMFSFDDFSYWGLSAKAFLAYDGFKVPYGIINQGQTNAMPIFNSFITFFSGYREGYLFSGMWIVYWAFLLLPISHLKWDRWKVIGIYAFLVYALLMFTSHHVRPNLYNDIMLGVISGSLVSYYYVAKGKSNFSVAIILLGVIVLPHIKYFTGLAFSFFVLITCYFNKKTLDYFAANVRQKLTVISFTIAPILSHLLQSFIRPQYIAKHTFTVDMHSWCTPGESLAAAISTYIGIGLVLLIALSIICIVLSKKKKRYMLQKIFVAAGALFFIALLGYLYLKLDEGSKHLINAFIKNLLALKINDLYAYKIIGVLLVLDILIYYLFIKEEYKEKYKKLSAAFIIMGLFYCIGMMATYSRFSEAEALASASLYRYISSFIVFVLFSAMGAMSAKNILIKNRAIFFVGIVVIYTVIVIMPAPLTLYNYEKNQLKYEQTGLYQNYILAEFIKDNTDMGDTIYLLNQGGNGMNRLYMNYFAVSRTISNEDSLGPSKYEGDRWSKDFSAQEWANYIKGIKYDYLYIINTDDYFFDTYSEMFESDNDIVIDGLYKIVYGDDIIFKKVG